MEGNVTVPIVDELMGKSVRMNALNNAFIDAAQLTITGKVSTAESIEVNWVNKANSFIILESAITNPGATSGQIAGNIFLKTGIDGNLHYMPIYRA